MFKFLRRYNKWILAVGGVLLMITFLIPQAITSLSQSAGQSGASVAKVDHDQNVSAREWAQVQSEVQLMERLGVRFRGLGPVQRPAHWYLLVREADQAGLVGKVTLTDDELNMFGRATQQRDPEAIREAFSRINGVNMLINLFENSATYSDRRLQAFAERMMHMTGAEMVVIEADPKRSDLQPSDEELQKQLDTYADTIAGEGDMGFGYKLPDRAKIEWISVPVESVRELVRRSEAFSGVAQRVHWRKHAPKSGETPDPAKPNARNFPPVDDSGVVPEVVRNDLLNDLSTQKLDEIAKFATSQIQRNRMGVPDRDGFAVLPADWDSLKINFQQLAGDIQKQFGIELPAYVAPGSQWLSFEDVNALPGLGSAVTDKFGRPATLGALFKAAKEFGGTGSPPVQENIAGPPMKGEDGSLYLFRIIDTDGTRKPNSLDEVRDKVVKDLKRLADFRRLEAAAIEIEREAQKDGLLKVALDNDTVVQRKSNVALCSPHFALNQAMNGQPVQALVYPLPVLGSDRPTTEAIIDRALALPKDQPLTNLPAEQTTFVIPSKDKLSLVVVRLTDQNPLTKELFTQLVQAGGVQSLMISEAMPGYGEVTKPGQAPTDPIHTAFGLEALKKRHNFVEREGDVTAPPKPEMPFDSG